jgi:hypothetical protein
MIVVTTVGLACDEAEVEPEPEVATLRLVLGGSTTVDINAETGAGGPIVISGSTSFSAQFLKVDGSPETLVTDADFRLDVTPTNTAIVTFTRSGAFAGTFNKVSTGSTTITFALYHLEEMHDEFSWPVPITVN